uniref:Calcium binding EGF domain containing protein n=1 Tax=Oryza sativa subsp. japonica TaxID=39947 RepID=Q33AJ9_ORYSJ|nr:Calcium binding EGF domain containing protein [Oryza sativa Japonica Group]
MKRKRRRRRSGKGNVPPSSPPTAILAAVFVDSDQTVDLVHPSLGVRKLHAVVADRVSLVPQQILASLARPRRARRVPHNEGTDLTATIAREGFDSYVLAVLRRSHRECRGGRSRPGKKAVAATAGDRARHPEAPPPDGSGLPGLDPLAGGDIDECALPGIMSNCSFNSVCVNRPGGFDCPCKRGMTGDGKRGTCTENFPPAAKAAVGLSSFIVFIVLIFMVKQHLKLKKFYEQNGGPVLKGVRNIKIYTKKELKQITSNYSSDIGEGASGKVYMGTLKGGQQVAIKKSKKVDEERKSEFTQEVILQSEMKHKNIIQLFGCCLEVDVPMLVYEFTVKGSLHDVLFKCDENMKGNLHDVLPKYNDNKKGKGKGKGKVHDALVECDGNKNVSLHDVLFKCGDKIAIDTLLEIAIGSAEGLTYMHTARETPIRHGDLKSGNILIDNNFVPKISDFGTSRSLVAGHKFRPDKFIPADMNYIDPVYMEDGMLTEKSDIYSFGIVLIELVTRKPAKYDDDRSYVRNFIQAYLDKREREKCHKEITPDVEINILEMDKRPDMIEVERQLHRIRHIAGQRIEEKKEEFQRAFPRTGSVISNGFKASSLSGRVPVTKQRSLM